MKRILLGLTLLWGAISVGQNGAPAMPYYNGFNFNQSGTALKNALAVHLDNKHTINLTYPQVWSALQIVDMDPANSNNVLLIYGWENGSDSNVTNDRSRSKTNNGGDSGQWNREHTFAQGLGNPSLGQTGPGADAHHLRAADVQRNNDRGSLLFDAGSGIPSYETESEGWYPGDEWKGDVARMVLYMYLRYGNQCKPTFCAMGPTVASDVNVPLLLLQWNAEDPVSAFEDNRNTYLSNASSTYRQGNRNPFIDNPYLATMIWGGPVAQNRWPSLATFDAEQLMVSVYPNPAQDKVYIDTEQEVQSIELININGQLVQQIRKPSAVGKTYTVENLPKGFYILRINTDNQTESRKLIVN